VTDSAEAIGACWGFGVLNDAEEVVLLRPGTPASDEAAEAIWGAFGSCALPATNSRR